MAWGIVMQQLWWAGVWCHVGNKIERSQACLGLGCTTLPGLTLMCDFLTPAVAGGAG